MGLDVDNNPIKNLYVWSDSTTSWTNAGNIQGPQGEPGQGIQGEKGDPGTTTWSGITDKPAAFPPSAHTHTIPQITGLENALELKFTVADGGEIDDLTTVTKYNLVSAINEINAKPTGGDTTGLETRINTLYKLSTSLIRSDALRTLREEAEGILEDGRGTVFAHDMNGNIIGMTLDEVNSQNIVIRDGKMMMLAKSEVTKTVTDATVVASAYDTGGNGGRKLVRLSNGWLVAAVHKNVSTFGVNFYVSKDNGLSWTQLTYMSQGWTGPIHVSLVSVGTRVYCLTSATSTTSTNMNVFDAVTVSNSDITTVNRTFADVSQISINTISLTINPEGTELHAIWSSKNATYTNSFNLRYAKGVISQVDGSVTWGTVVQVTSMNVSGYNYTYPTIVLDGNNSPVILCAVGNTNGSGNYMISVFTYNGSTWVEKGVHLGGSYIQLAPSAIFVPKSINGLANGRIWVAWYGKSAEYPTYHNVYVSSSDDGGATWSVVLRLTASGASGTGNIMMPSITADKTNKVTVVFEVTGSFQQINQMHNINGGWNSTQETIKTVGVGHSFPSTLFDDKFSISSQTVPPLIYMDTGKVGFYGTWKEPVETPTLTAKAVYNIPSTDYVGAFVKKIGVTTVKAYVNDVLTDAELVDNEYQFVKQLDAEAPVKLRLELSRANVSGGENDAVTRILGGRA